MVVPCYQASCINAEHGASLIKSTRTTYLLFSQQCQMCSRRDRISRFNKQLFNLEPALAGHRFRRLNRDFQFHRLEDNNLVRTVSMNPKPLNNTVHSPLSPHPPHHPP